MIYYPKAKINIGLSVQEKRTDNYHNIDSFIYCIPFCDILEIIPSENNLITYSGLKIEADTEFISEVLDLLSKSPDSPKFKVHLHKRIPSGAGLGGGSSDLACFVEHIMSLINDSDLKDEVLELMIRLSSDANFFYNSCSALVSGKGDLVRDVHVDLKGYQLLLFLPDKMVDTANYYDRIDVRKAEMNWSLLSKGPSEWKSNLFNSFESIYSDDNPEYQEYREILYSLCAEFVSLSGTGSSFYAIFRQQQEIPVELKGIPSMWFDL